MLSRSLEPCNGGFGMRKLEPLACVCCLSVVNNGYEGTVVLCGVSILTQLMELALPQFISPVKRQTLS